MEDNSFSLAEIHKSIDSTLKSLKLRLTEVESLIEDSSNTKQLVEDVLRPACQDLNLSELRGIVSLRRLLALHQDLVQSLTAPKKNPAKEQTKQEQFFLPAVPSAAPYEKIKPRPPASAGVRYPAISPRLTQSPRVSSCGSRMTAVSLCQVRTPSSGSNTTDSANLLLVERHASLCRFCDRYEKCNCKMQEMFTSFTQKVLVPLQTFCKPISYSFKDSPPTEKGSSSDVMNLEKQFPKDLSRNEFFLVETLNKCREVLWQNDSLPDYLLYSAKTIDKAFGSKQDECFTVANIHLNVVQKFALAIKCATMWLKRDEIYTENAKSGFSRAHRRFVKTKKMWQEAREKRRELSEEWKCKNHEIQSQEMRLETLKNEMETLQEHLVQAQDERQTVEIQLLNATTGIDCLRVRHREQRRKINSANKKLEAKERRCALVESRLRSVKADRDALCEKLQINLEFVESLQERLVKVFTDREAWKRRYEEKTNSETLKCKLDSARLHVPSAILCEKTFVLKSRSENLRDAITIVTNRLESTGTPWSLLCHYLNWPKQFLLSLRSSNARDRRRAFSDRESSSSSSSALSQSEEKSSEDLLLRRFTTTVSTQRIVNYVKSNCPGSECDRCAFMLKLWLDKNGHLATLELLLKALQDVRSAEDELIELRQNADA